MFHSVNVGAPLKDNNKPEVDSPQRKNMDGSGECLAVAVSQLLEHSSAPDYKGVYLIYLIVILLRLLLLYFSLPFF